MFSWSIAKSAEAMFSRWAIKRVCKFMLKKKLGKFILGDIDLNQLDVQLSAGTIQLNDLALNVDYINQKLGAAPVIVKEGSVGSLVVTMPWKEGGCRIEIDELEIVIAPHRAKASTDSSESTSQSEKGSKGFVHGFGKQDKDATSSRGGNAPVDVHEGVKTIAKMVKWLLTSFHVKVKKLIVALDPLVDEESNFGLDRIMVLRISEAECGTQISEDASPSSFTEAQNFLGLSRLTSFIKFQGAVLELLHVDGLRHQSPPDNSVETSSCNLFSGYCSSGNMATIIAGEKGGFSGNLKLSIPWKNGSLDIRRVDADLHIEPLELRFQPSTIRYFIFVWDLFKALSGESDDLSPQGPSSSLLVPRSFRDPDTRTPGNEGSVTNSRLLEKEPTNVLLSESHLISDWVSRTQNGRYGEEPDFGESVDQFFECFDGLRNSQSALGNSGVWNWTASVFTAITAASNIASGSLHVPEQLHVETKFNATIAKASLLFSFIDEEHKPYPKRTAEMEKSDDSVHSLCAQFVNLCLVFQVRPDDMDFEVTVDHVQLVDHLCCKFERRGIKEHDCCVNSENDVASIWKLQDDVEGALWSFWESRKAPGLDRQAGCPVNISLSSKEDINRCCHMRNVKDDCLRDATVTLLKTSGLSRCHVMVNSGSSGGLLTERYSFSLKLPEVVCWINFDLIIMMLDFLNEVANDLEKSHAESGVKLESETKRSELPRLDDHGKVLHQLSTKAPAKVIVESNIFLPNARIILYFPLMEHTDLSCYPCYQFIAFDFISTGNRGKNLPSAKPMHADSNSHKSRISASHSLHLNLGDLYSFAINADSAQNIVNIRSSSWQETGFSVEEIVSAVSRTGNLSVISMFWQEGTVTGPWIAKKAKLLASSESARSEHKVVGRSHEFASVTTINDVPDFDEITRQEILSSSAFFLHAQLPPVTVNLGKSQYENLCHLVNHVFRHFTSVVSDSRETRKDDPASQASILVECDSVTVTVSVEPVRDTNCSMLKELPGSWLSITLEVAKFEFLSVSDIGGTRGANFFSMSHHQGSLWGSITEGMQREFLLISCSDSTMGRGDGEGSNVLSSRFSGSNIVNFWDPESNHNFTSVTVKCATIVAIGGRLDWFNTIISFFSRPPSDLESPGNDKPEKASGSSFILNLVDVGLSYEPHYKRIASGENIDPKLTGLNIDDATDELPVACLLAASSLKLSNTTVVGRTVGEYKIKLQDLGMLICNVSSGSKLVGSSYSVDHLRKFGYVKVAQEAHVEILLKTNCENGHAWELECADSHIMLNTCHDTTSGIIRLAGQLQKLFAPDMRDFVVHLENRWNDVQQVHDNSTERALDGEVSPSASQTHLFDKGLKVGSLMEEVCEDVFQLEGNSDSQSRVFESSSHTWGSDCPAAASSSEDNIPEFIEEYFLSDLRPLSGLCLQNHSSDSLHRKTAGTGESRIGNGGWYGDSSLKILENHASKVHEQSNVKKLVVSEASTTSTSDSVHVGQSEAEGCVIVKNMNVTWRMYGGSDWPNFPSSQPSGMTYGRDVTTCLELAFSGIDVDYDLYPEGDLLASKLVLGIRDFCLNDRSECAPWKLVLGYYHSKKHPRNLSSDAVKLNLEAVKPDTSIPLEENRLRISLLPIRLHLHQSQLDFLISFFGGKGSSADAPPSDPLGFGISGEPYDTNENIEGLSICKEAFLTYFQKFDVCPMLIRVDYTPHRVDLTALSGGKYVELVNLVPWKGVELQLKRVQGVGLYGWDSICEAVLGEWLIDISQNQIHKLLKGLPPIKSLVAVGSGAAKLWSLPAKSYKKDRRLLKGMQRGTIAFLRSISLEAIGLGVHLAGGAHNILLQAEYILTSIPPSVPWPVEGSVATNVRSNQPEGAQQGIAQAYKSISDGLGKSASALVQTPLKKYQRGASMGSALATAVQAAPAAAIAPASAAARAVHCALLGFRNSLDPEHRRESVEKYLGRNPSQKSMQQ